MQVGKNEELRQWTRTVIEPTFRTSKCSMLTEAIGDRQFSKNHHKI
ncbi:hypothetical protein [Scytonema sp. NUACC26]